MCPLCVLNVDFFTPTLLIQFPALNLIDTSYFDNCSWGLLTTISLIKEKEITFFYLLFKRKIYFFCHGESKASYLHLHCQQEGVGTLDAYQRNWIKLSRSYSQKYLYSFQVNLVGLHMVIFKSEPKMRDPVVFYVSRFRRLPS